VLLPTSGRNPIHVNTQNLGIGVHNKNNSITGFAGIPVPMTGIAELMKRANYTTTMAGKWDAGMVWFHEISLH
jgi:arylsulfatase I/J